MAQLASKTTLPLPRWLLIAVSAVIVLHLAAVGFHVLASPSGPWLSPFGPSMGLGPQFARSVDDTTVPAYLGPTKFLHTYHFYSNKPDLPGAALEVRLKDEHGQVFQTLNFPDPNANAFVRERQTALARNLASDQPITPPATGVV